VSRFGRTAGPVRLRRQRPGLRRLLSAGIACLAVALGLKHLAPTPPTPLPVLVAARDVAAGHRLTSGDLRVASWPPGSGPDGRLSNVAPALGRVSAGPLRRGAVVTSADLLGPGLLTGQPPDLLAVPVRLADGALGGLVGRGDRVDVISAVTSSTVVEDAVVLADPAPGPADGGGLDLGSSLTTPSGGDGSGSAAGSVILGVPSWAAERLAHAGAVGPLTIAVRPR
jgi:Flp pilus assembly protein CpaB